MNDDRFEYFRNKIIEHLSELENEEKGDIRKSLIAEEGISKGRGLPIGTVRDWKGRKFIKVAPGRWRPKYDGNTRGAKLAVAAIKRKAESCKTSEELLNLVLEHKDRFSDGKGNPLLFVQELSKYISGHDTRSEKTSNSLTDEDKKRIIEKLSQNRIPMMDIKFTRERYNELFPRGEIDTPIGKVKMGEHQFERLKDKGRENLLGAMYQTLKEPIAIIDSKDEQDRMAKLFIKTFNEGNTLAVIIDRDGKPISVSFGQRKDKQVEQKIKMASSLYYEIKGGGPTIGTGKPLPNTYYNTSGSKKVKIKSRTNGKLDTVEDVKNRYYGTPQWLKAPNGKPTKLTEKQWCQVRTENFKAWFGDWEKAAELTLQEGIQKQEALNYLDKLIGIPLINENTGITAFINTTQRNKIISNAATRKSENNGFSYEVHNAAASIIDKLWKHAVLFENREDKNRDVNIKSIKRFIAPFTFKGNTSFAYMTAKESVRDGHRIYSLELEEIKAVEGMLETLKEQSPTSTTLTMNSLKELAASVNADFVSKVVDENGEPRVIDGCFVNFNQATFFTEKIKIARDNVEKIVEWENESGLSSDTDAFWHYVLDRHYLDAVEIAERGHAIHILQEAIKKGIDPKLRIAFRYGDVPTSMVSYNFRDNRRERGVSVVGRVADLNTKRNGYYEAFFGNNTYNVVIGVDVGNKGADGEMLLSPAIVIGAAKNIEKILKSATDNDGTFNPNDSSIIKSTRLMLRKKIAV